MTDLPDDDLEQRLSFDLVAAALRSDLADTPAFLEALAVRLEGALPSAVEVRRSSGLLGRRRQVRRVMLTLGDDRFTVEARGDGLLAERAHVVRGITLRRDELSLAAWIDDLARALADHAATVAADRAAVERLLH
jgi:hypothetical protein